MYTSLVAQFKQIKTYHDTVISPPIISLIIHST